MEITRKMENCKICESPETAAAILAALLDGNNLRDSGKPFGLSSKKVGLHVRNHLPTETTERIAAANRKIESNTYSAKIRPDHRARRRAEEILVLAGIGRETTGTLRSSIPLSEKDFEILGDFFGAAFARNLRTERDLILREFDNLVSQGKATDPDIAARRARIIELNRRSHSRDRERMARAPYQPRKRVARNSDWDF